MWSKLLHQATLHYIKNSLDQSVQREAVNVSGTKQSVQRETASDSVTKQSVQRETVLSQGLIKVYKEKQPVTKQSVQRESVFQRVSKQSVKKTTTVTWGRPCKVYKEKQMFSDLGPKQSVQRETNRQWLRDQAKCTKWNKQAVTASLTLTCMTAQLPRGRVTVMRMSWCCRSRLATTWSTMLQTTNHNIHYMPHLLSQSWGLFSASYTQFNTILHGWSNAEAELSMPKRGLSPKHIPGAPW